MLAILVILMLAILCKLNKAESSVSAYAIVVLGPQAASILQMRGPALQHFPCQAGTLLKRGGRFRVWGLGFGV